MVFNDSASIERELAPGERVLWKGRPQGGIKFRSQDAFALPFGLVWCTILIYAGHGFTSQGRGDGSAFFPTVILGLFLIVGFYMMIGRFLVDAYTRSRMEYALTDRRALIVSKAFKRTVRSIDYRSEPDISLEERGNGGGTIYFGEQRQGKNKIESSGSLSGFDMIDNARDVYQRILKAKESGPR